MLFRPALERFLAFIDSFIPEKCRRNPDQVRRSRIIIHFGVEGVLFGAAYVLFYLAIGHLRGAAVLTGCVALCTLAPVLLKRTGNLSLTGHLLVGALAATLTLLSLMEGGVHGHAMAWLAAVPLCALLIIGGRPALVWAAISFVVGASIGIAALLGVELDPLYDSRWHLTVDVVGSVGIILFLFILGLVFEVSRAEAAAQVQASMDRLIASNAQLAHLNNEKTEFLGIAAHDLRNPLSGIFGFAQLLQKEPSVTAVECGQSIIEESRRMIELINDLLDANAIEEGRYVAQIESVDLRPLAEASLQHHQTASERKRISLDLRAGPPCWARANRKATLQIFDNLISNAVKYSPPGSRVTLTLRADRTWASLAVRDQGPGISDQDQARLFQKYARLSARPTGGEASAGLGLSIVKRLAEDMGGSIVCKSILGEGATFTLQLPASQEERAPVAS